jgi:Ankyrin repeats (3 copies)
MAMLLSYHANANLRNYDGHTALLKACMMGSLEAVNVLLGYHADWRVKDYEQDYTPLMICAAKRHRPLMEVRPKQRTQSTAQVLQKSCTKYCTIAAQVLHKALQHTRSPQRISVRDRSPAEQITRADHQSRSPEQITSDSALGTMQ